MTRDPRLWRGGRAIEFTTNDGCQISYVDQGSGDRLPVLLLHGFSSCSEVYGDLITALSRDRRVIAPDQRGHGWSGKPGWGYRIPRLAADLRGLLEHLDLPSVDLVAYSMGCAVIWSYIDLFGLDRLRKLVLVDCEPWSIDLLDNRGHGVVTPADAGELTSRIDEGWDVDREPLLTGFVGDASERTYGMSAAWAARLPAGPAARLAFSFLSSDWRDVIPRISVPTLVIGAGNGGVPQAAVDWVAENLPDGSLVRLDNVSHMVMLEAPERFTGAVTQFLNRDATPAASASASVRAG